MQDFSSTLSFSPSFSDYASGEFAAAAVKVSHEIQNYHITDYQSVKVDFVNDQKDADFEFQTSPFHETHNSSTSRRSYIDNDVAAVAYLWSPLTSPAASEIIKRSEYSPRTPKRCRLKKLLTRSRSDGAISSQSASKRCILKDLLMWKSHRNDGNASKTSSSAVKRKEKTASCKIGEGDNRQKSYLPYRQDLIGVFAGIRRLRH